MPCRLGFFNKDEKGGEYFGRDVSRFVEFLSDEFARSPVLTELPSITYHTEDGRRKFFNALGGLGDFTDMTDDCGDRNKVVCLGYGLDAEECEGCPYFIK